MAFNWGPVIGAGISTVGSLLGGRAANRSAQGINQASIDFAREAAQNSVRWKVEDAKAAGLHPLAVLGGVGAQPASPAFVQNPWHGSTFGQVAESLGPVVGEALDLYMDEIDDERQERRDWSNWVRAAIRDARSRSEAKRRSDRLVSVDPRYVFRPWEVTDDRGGRWWRMSAGRDGWVRVPDLVPAEEVENQFGGLSGEAYGLGEVLQELLRR